MSIYGHFKTLDARIPFSGASLGLMIAAPGVRKYIVLDEQTVWSALNTTFFAYSGALKGPIISIGENDQESVKQRVEFAENTPVYYNLNVPASTGMAFITYHIEEGTNTPAG